MLLRQFAPAQLVPAPDHERVGGVGHQVGQDVGQTTQGLMFMVGPRSHWNVENLPGQSAGWYGRYLGQNIEYRLLGLHSDCIRGVIEVHE